MLWVRVSSNVWLPRFNHLFSKPVFRARGGRTMPDFVISSGKYRKKLLTGENLFMWTRRMKHVLRSKQCWDTFIAEEVQNGYVGGNSNWFSVPLAEVSLDNHDVDRR